MATQYAYYVPADSAFKSDGAGAGQASMRFGFNQSYNALTNQSTLTIGIQFTGRTNDYGGTFRLTNGNIYVNGTSLQTFTADLDYRAVVNVGSSSGVWEDCTRNGSVAQWTYTLQHSSDGSATVTCSLESGPLRLSRINPNDGKNYSFYDNSSSVSFRNYPRFTLTISAGTGANISVTRTGSSAGAGTGALSNGAAIYYGDTLSVSYSAQTGYQLASTSPAAGSYTVSGNLTVSATASVLNYTLTISAGAGSTIGVSRTSSPLQGAGTGALSNGSAIYYGDTLTVTFGASQGYTLSVHTVNGTTRASGYSFSVSENVAVVATAAQNTYTLTITRDANTTVTVKRGAQTLASGATLYYGDQLSVTITSESGYELATHTVNGSSVSSPYSMSVTGNVAVVGTSTPLGFIYVRVSGAWAAHLIYIWVSYVWKRYRAYVWHNGAWRAC